MTIIDRESKDDYIDGESKGDRKRGKMIIDRKSKGDYRQRKQDDRGPIETKEKQVYVMKERQADKGGDYRD
jgi:hypothetical protein